MLSLPLDVTGDVGGQRPAIPSRTAAIPVRNLPASVPRAFFPTKITRRWRNRKERRTFESFSPSLPLPLQFAGLGFSKERVAVVRHVIVREVPHEPARKRKYVHINGGVFPSLTQAKRRGRSQRGQLEEEGELGEGQLQVLHDPQHRLGLDVRPWRARRNKPS